MNHNKVLTNYQRIIEKYNLEQVKPLVFPLVILFDNSLLLRILDKLLVSPIDLDSSSFNYFDNGGSIYVKYTTVYNVNEPSHIGFNTFKNKMYYSENFDVIKISEEYNSKNITKTYYSFIIHYDLHPEILLKSEIIDKQSILNMIKSIENIEIPYVLGVKFDNNNTYKLRYINDIIRKWDKYSGDESYIEITTSNMIKFEIETELIGYDEILVLRVLTKDIKTLIENIPKIYELLFITMNTLFESSIITFIPESNIVIIQTTKFNYMTTFDRIIELEKIFNYENNYDMSITCDIPNRKYRINIDEDNVIINNNTFKLLNIGKHESMNYFFKDKNNIKILIPTNYGYVMKTLPKQITDYIVNLHKKNIKCENSLYSPKGIFLVNCGDDKEQVFVNNYGNIIKV